MRAAAPARTMATAAMKWDDPLLIENSLLTEDERLIMHNARSYCQVSQCTGGCCVCSGSVLCPTRGAGDDVHPVLHRDTATHAFAYHIIVVV